MGSDFILINDFVKTLGFLLKGLVLLCACASVQAGLQAKEHTNARTADLAIVIDDVGYNKPRGLRAISLPVPITIAVLPFAPHTQSLALASTRAGKDLIIHQPMEAIPSAHVRLEQDTLTSAMSPSQFDSTIQRAISAVPQTVGFSNHTGSLLTTQREPMQRFMRHLQARDMIFLDSRTTASTVAQQVANEFGVRTLRRDVFLDHHRTEAAIEDAFNQAVRVARRKGTAVLVGHPYPVTLSFLEKMLADPPGDINFVGLQEIVLKRRALALESLADPSPNHPKVLALDSRLTNPRISLGQ